MKCLRVLFRTTHSLMVRTLIFSSQPIFTDRNFIYLNNKQCTIKMIH